MPDLLPPWPRFTAFLLASLALAVTPGPGVLYIVARSLLQGRRAGLVSVAGVALGNLGNALVAGALAPALHSDRACRLGGGVFIGLGLFAALGGPRSTNRKVSRRRTATGARDGRSRACCR